MYFWDDVYETLFRDGEYSSPRGRKTLEVVNAMYQALPSEHFDARVGRKISLSYIFREFLWFLQGNRYDTRMEKYALLWKSCVDPDGGINSNYGQYLFGPFPGIDTPFFHALDHIIGDTDSRRAWIAIFQEWHQYPMYTDGGEPYEHPEVPCTTGMGFRLRNGELYMNVHMRSQDVWHGAANDEAVCYLFQLLAVAYLGLFGVACTPGPITHYVDSLHFYERHFDKAKAAIGTEHCPDVLAINELCLQGFTPEDVLFLRGYAHAEYQPSPLLSRILSIEGDYGRDEFEGTIV